MMGILLHSKELVIVLTQNEKRTFRSFYALFLGSTFILLGIIFFLFYQTKADFYRDITISKMQIYASQLASKIVYAHMQNTPLRKSELVVENGYKFGLYDNSGNAVLTYIGQKVILNHKFSQNGNNLILIDNSVGGHLGISYIAIEENVLFNTLNELQNKIIISYVLLYIFVVVFGFYLTKQFIKPIVQQRIKLNNFIKDTTHELNTPISAIVMSINDKQPMTQKSHERILISAKRISEIYDDLTYLFLNSENRKNIEALNLETIIKEQTDYFKLFAQKKQIELFVQTEPFVYNIDKESFIRLFNNLLSNAIKYTPMSGNIFVTLKKGILTIKDSGNGIKKKDIDKIFQRFYRADAINGGFGIGLSIVKTVCDTYNIKIEVDSKINEGSEFRLTLK